MPRLNSPCRFLFPCQASPASSPLHELSAQVLFAGHLEGSGRSLQSGAAGIANGHLH